MRWNRNTHYLPDIPSPKESKNESNMSLLIVSLHTSDRVLCADVCKVYGRFLLTVGVVYRSGAS